MKYVITAALLAALVIPAQAEVYKCSIEGKLVFSDAPCPLKKGERDPIPKEGTKKPQAMLDQQAKQEIEDGFKALGGSQQSCEDWLKTPATVTNSKFDGSVDQVKQYLNLTLKDPDSLKVQSWGQVTRICSGYTVTVKYRAKNSFNAYVPNLQRFNMARDGSVVSADPVK